MSQQAEDYARLKVTGTILIFLAFGCMTVGLLVMVVPSLGWTIFFEVLAMVFAGYAFDQFEKATIIKPIEPIVIPLPPVHEIDLITSELRNGGFVNAQVDIHFLNPTNAPNVLPRIKSYLVRGLHRYALKIDKLADDPYLEIDAVFQEAVEPLKQELGLDRLALHTIEVKTEKSGKSRVRGSAFGE
jgi:hypothetical protein